MKTQTEFAYIVILSVGAALLGCGGTKKPDDVEMKKVFAGTPGKKFDPNELQPEVRARYEKYMKTNGQAMNGAPGTMPPNK